MSAHALGSGCDAEQCITCSDEGIAMRVMALDEARGLALCEGEDGERATVEIALVDDVAAGDRLLVHAAVALARLSRAAGGRSATSGRGPRWPAEVTR